MYRPFLAALALGALGIVIAACGHKTATVESDGEVKNLGYALFEVQVPQHSTYVVNVSVDGAQPGETFLLLASSSPPQNAGWFDATVRPPQCSHGDLATRAELRDECQLGGEGFLVDEGPGGQPLQHGIGDVLDCGGDDAWCKAYYAVVAAPRIDGTRAAHVMVETGSDDGTAHEARIRQLQ